MTPEERYLQDAEFRNLVDVLTHAIVECQFTPKEVREAAILASIRYETIHDRPFYIYVQATGELKRVDGHHGRNDD
jgi:hypothetical protein